MNIDLSTRGIVRNDPAAASFNRTIIQQAIDDAFNDGGGIVQFDNSGDFWVDVVNTVAIENRSNITLRGTGHGSVLRLSGEAAGHLVNHSETVNAAVIDMGLDGSRGLFEKGAVPGVHCIRTTRGSKNFRVIGCMIKGAIYYGIGMQWSTTNMEADIDFLLDNNLIYGCGGWSTAGANYGDAVDIKYGRNGTIRANKIRSIAQRGIDVRGIGNHVIGNSVEDCKLTGIALRGNSGPSGYPIGNPGKISAVGNFVSACGEHGIIAFEESTSTNEGRYTITGNVVEGCDGKGITVGGPSNLMRATISGNTARSNALGNVVVSSSYDRVKVGTNQSA